MIQVSKRNIHAAWVELVARLRERADLGTSGEVPPQAVVTLDDLVVVTIDNPAETAIAIPRVVDPLRYFLSSMTTLTGAWPPGGTWESHRAAGGGRLCEATVFIQDCSITTPPAAAFVASIMAAGAGLATPGSLRIVLPRLWAERRVLAAFRPGEYPCPYGGIDPVPIIRDNTTPWFLELKMFVETPAPAMGHREFFFRRVANPIRRAFNLSSEFRPGALDDARAAARECMDFGWREAASRHFQEA